MKLSLHRPSLVLGGVALLALAAGAAHPEDGGTPAAAGLVGVHWRWVHFSPPGAAPPLVPQHPERYWLEFRADGGLAFQADCNRGAGTWTHQGAELKLQALATTLAACPTGSLDSRFTQLLGAVRRASVLGRTLLLRLSDGGVLHFEAAPDEAPRAP